MSKRVQYFLVGAVCFLMGCLVTQQLPFVRAQDTKSPKWSHGLEFRVRKAGEVDWSKETKRFGIEVFKDENNGNLVYITETGAIAVAPAK